MSFKKLFVYTGLIAFLSLTASYGHLEKEKYMGGGDGTDFSYDSRYAHRNDGTVNLLTGRPSYHMNLLKISSNSGLAYDVNLDYLGVSDMQIYKSNEEAPAGNFGLGWNLGTCSIYAEFHGSLDMAKHEYFLKDEDGSISEIKRYGNSRTTYTFQIKNHPYWKLTPEWDQVGDNTWQFRDRIKGWKIMKPDGMIIRYGYPEPTAQRYLPRGPNGFDPDGNQQIYYQWDIATIEDVKSCNGGSLTPPIKFIYKQTQTLSAVQNYTNQKEVYHGSKQGNTNCPCDQYGNDAYSRILVTMQWIDNFAIRYICTCWKPISGVNKYYYISSSYLKTITTDRGDVVTFNWINQANSESCSFSSDDPECLDEIDYNLAGQTGSIQKLKFTYSGYPNEIVAANADVGNPKRLLTGITSIINGNKEQFNKLFVYGQNGNDFALLTKIIDPMINKTTIFNYAIQQVKSRVSGKTYSVEVVKQINSLSGLNTNPDVALSYSYTSDPGKQDYDEKSGTPYWGAVTESNSAKGSVVTEFELNKSGNMFGERKDIKKYSTSSKMVSSETYTYGLETFGQSPDQWYFPVLIKTTNVNNGVVSESGTSLCAIDPNSGLAKLSWVKNSDGSYLVTKRKYAYEIHSEMGTNGTNQLSQVASTMLYKLSSYDPSDNSHACDLSSGKVVKASYTKYIAKNQGGKWFPSATYVWNIPIDKNGITAENFVEFNETNPKANHWQITSTIDKYDDYGNVIQISNSLGVPNSTIYGTSGYLPVAQIDNSKYDECFFTSFEEDQKWNFNNNVGHKNFDRDKTIQKNGQWSGVINNTSTTSEIYAESPWQTLDVGETGIKKFTFSGWVYSTGPQAEIYFYASVDSKTPENGHYTNLVTPDNSANKWVFLQGTFDAPAGAKYFMIRVDNIKAIGANTKVYFDDIKFYPSSSIMTVTYYDPTWLTPILTVGANENPSDLVKLDEYGRPVNWYKVDKNLSSNDQTGYKIKMSKEYHLMGQDLHLLCPVGAERLIPGQSYSIKWTNSTNIGSEGVDLLFYDGTYWGEIATITDLNQNAYLWTVPNMEGTEFLIKVQNHSDVNEKSQCPTSFTISNYLKVTQPVGGEVFYTSNKNALPWNKPHNIQWTTNGGLDANVQIDYFDGTSWRVVTNSTTNNGSYGWVATGTPTVQNCRIRISDANTGTISHFTNLFSTNSNYGYIRKFSH